MSTEKIKLPDFVIADLYKGCLVDIGNYSSEKIKPLAEKPQKKAETPAPKVEKINYLGENKKKATIIVNQPEAVYLNKDDLTFLTNILKACQLNPADIAIINIAAQEITFTKIKEQLDAAQIVLFDVEPSVIKIPFMIPPFQVQNYDGCKIMIAPALSSLNNLSHEGRLLKTKLWVSLKQLFGIS